MSENHGEQTSQNDDDSLDGADIGTTVSVRSQKTLHEVNYTPEEFYGIDRDADVELTDATIITDENGDQQIRLTWDGELMKVLPRRWDYHSEPITEAEKKAQRRMKWLKRAGTAASLALPIGLAMFIYSRVTSTLAGQTVTFVEPTGTFVELVPVVLVFVIAAIIVWGAAGGLPRSGPRSRYR